MTNTVGSILTDIQTRMNEIMKGEHSIISLPSDIENIAAAVYNLSRLVEKIFDDQTK